jgi:GTP-binding protein YchF
VLGEVDAARDIDIVETELLLADLEVIDRAIEKRVRNWKTSPRQYAREEGRFRVYRENLAAGVPLRTLKLDQEGQAELKSLGLLTGKPVLYVANISESDYGDSDHPCEQRIRQSRITQSPVIVMVSAQFEWELQQLSEAERNEFTEALGLTESGLDLLIRRAYELLELIRFYTVVSEKLRAWEIPAGATAPRAAGKIHTDMERGFIRAQVASHSQVIEFGGMQALHRAGQIRTEGKEYVVRDGDVIEFLFSP